MIPDILVLSNKTYMKKSSSFEGTTRAHHLLKPYKCKLKKNLEYIPVGLDVFRKAMKNETPSLLIPDSPYSATVIVKYALDLSKIWKHSLVIPVLWTYSTRSKLTLYLADTVGYALSALGLKEMNVIAFGIGSNVVFSMLRYGGVKIKTCVVVDPLIDADAFDIKAYGKIIERDCEDCFAVYSPGICEYRRINNRLSYGFYGPVCGEYPPNIYTIDGSIYTGEDLYKRFSPPVIKKFLAEKGNIDFRRK